MGPIVTPELVLKYIDGNCTPEEVIAIHQWYDDIQIRDDPFKDLNVEKEEALKLLMFDRFKTAVSNTEEPGLASRQGAPKFSFKTLSYVISGIAAMLFLVIGINKYNRDSSALHDSVGIKESSLLVLNNTTDQFYKKVLSDGSTVWLSPKSQLKYPEKFKGAYRQVKMSGSAFFEVSKDQAHPFVIYSGGLITKVWGTSFRINAYPGHPTEVSVVTGKVSVQLPEKKGADVMLLPSQKVIHHKKESTLTLAKDNQHSGMRIWQKASMKFDNIPVGLLLEQLNQHFNIHIYTRSENLNANLMKADVTDLNLAEILEILQGSLNVSYHMNGPDIELYPAN